MDRFLPLLLLFVPIGMIAVAVKVRRAREARGAFAGYRPTSAKSFDKSLRNGMLQAALGILLAPAGLYAFSLLSTRRYAALFMLPVVLGIVLLVRGYRTWMQGVAQIPEE